jgi:elongation factor G
VFRHLHRKQTGGPGEYALIEFNIQAIPWDRELDFVNATSGGAVPDRFAEAVRDGVLDAMRAGIIGVGPLVGVRFTLTGGATHPNDSSEHAFFAAGRDGFRIAARSLRIGVLEPIMSVVVDIASVHVGAVAGEIAARGGCVQAMDGAGRLAVRAEMPQGKLHGFHEALMGLTGGDVEWRWAFGRYALRGA